MKLKIILGLWELFLPMTVSSRLLNVLQSDELYKLINCYGYENLNSTRTAVLTSISMRMKCNCIPNTCEFG